MLPPNSFWKEMITSTFQSPDKKKKRLRYTPQAILYDDARNSLGIVPASNTFTVSVQGSKVNLIKRDVMQYVMYFPDKDSKQDDR